MTYTRLLAAPVILVLAALSFPRLEAYRRAHCYGWLSPAMDEHWRRLANWRDEGDFDHVAKNVLSEWVRLDAQRAGKLFAFLLCIALAAAMLFAVTGCAAFEAAYWCANAPPSPGFCPVGAQ